MNAPSRLRRPVLLASAVVLFTSGLADAQTGHRILVTNDDGIDSPGIQALALALTELGDVVVVAPCGQRSGASMSLELGKELRLRTFDRGGAFDEHCVDTTPAGAVFLAVTALVPAGGFDLVVSGINRGANVGDVSHGSGTVGGAMAAAFHGIPSVAASLGATARDFDYAAGFVAGFAARLLESAPDANVVFSINIPNETRDETRGVVVAPMGGSYLEIGYDEVESDDGARVFRPRFDRPRPYPAGSDSQAFADDMITITPLAFDWTAHDAIESVRRWNLSP